MKKLLLIICILFMVGCSQQKSQEEYFYYSQSQYEQQHGLIEANEKGIYYRRFIENEVWNYAKINGKIVLYTECTSNNDTPCCWKDYKYLGKGYYSHTVFRVLPIDKK